MGDCVAVWDSVLFYKMLVYGVDGKLVGSYSAYEGALGIKSVTWSPSGQFISIGSYDQVCVHRGSIYARYCLLY